MTSRTWKWKVPLLAAALALLVGLAIAQAEPVQQVTFRLTNVKPDGRFTLLFTARTFDTTTAVPPPLTENYLRLPRGAVLRRQFLNKRYYCDGPALRAALEARPNGQAFADRVANLKPFIRSLAKSKSRADRRALANAQTCDRARIGGGTAQVDARNFLASLKDLIPSKFSIFFSRGTVHGAIAGFTVLGAADAHSPIVKPIPIVAAVHVVLNANFFNDPSPDGLYGYKLELPVGPINGINVSIAELHVRTTGLTLLKGTCLATNRKGRCTKRQHKTLFWFTIPKCPPSGQFSFLSFDGYAPPTPSITTTKSLACPKFTA
jgi:hypothetical protein